MMQTLQTILSQVFGSNRKGVRGEDTGVKNVKIIHYMHDRGCPSLIEVTYISFMIANQVVPGCCSKCIG